MDEGRANGLEPQPIGLLEVSMTPKSACSTIENDKEKFSSF